MQLWPITVASTFECIPVVAVSAQQRPCSETSDCTAAVCCMGPAWGARWLWPAAECSTAAAAVQRNYGFLILIQIFSSQTSKLCLLTPCCLQVGVMMAQRRGGGGWVWLEPAKPPTSDAIGEEVQLTTVHNWSRSRYLVSTLHSTARTLDTGRSKIYSLTF